MIGVNYDIEAQAYMADLLAEVIYPHFRKEFFELGMPWEFALYGSLQAYREASAVSGECPEHSVGWLKLFGDLTSKLGVTDLDNPYSTTQEILSINPELLTYLLEAQSIALPINITKDGYHYIKNALNLAELKVDTSDVEMQLEVIMGNVLLKHFLVFQRNLPSDIICKLGEIKHLDSLAYYYRAASDISLEQKYLDGLKDSVAQLESALNLQNLSLPTNEFFRDALQKALDYAIGNLAVLKTESVKCENDSIDIINELEMISETHLEIEFAIKSLSTAIQKRVNYNDFTEFIENKFTFLEREEFYPSENLLTLKLLYLEVLSKAEKERAKILFDHLISDQNFEFIGKNKNSFKQALGLSKIFGYDPHVILNRFEKNEQVEEFPVLKVSFIQFLLNETTIDTSLVESFCREIPYLETKNLGLALCWLKEWSQHYNYSLSLEKLSYFQEADRQINTRITSLETAYVRGMAFYAFQGRNFEMFKEISRSLSVPSIVEVLRSLKKGNFDILSQ